MNMYVRGVLLDLLLVDLNMWWSSIYRRFMTNVSVKEFVHMKVILGNM